eukprot:237276-Chlamydomonas_euryale.AAC.1
MGKEAPAKQTGKVAPSKQIRNEAPAIQMRKRFHVLPPGADVHVGGGGCGVKLACHSWRLSADSLQASYTGYMVAEVVGGIRQDAGRQPTPM